MKALIVDDEEPARVEIRRLLSVHPDVEVAGEAANVAGALALTESLRPDVVFLDVQLIGESGFDYAGRVPEPAPRIVFVTAYDRHALRAFDCNALDYLLKPVHPGRLAETLRRVRDHEVPRQPAREDDAVFIKAGSVARFVPWRDVLRIAASGNYTRVRLIDSSDLIVLRPLKEWIALAPAALFAQVHRSILVQRAAIREIRSSGEKKRELVLDDGELVPVGREYAAALRDTLGGL